jgi:hypothetical protein
MAAREDPRTRLDRAWRAEELAELQVYASLERLSYARDRVAKRFGDGLGLDETAPRGIPTDFAAGEQRTLGAIAARLSLRRAALARATLARRRARQAVDRSRRRR